MFLNKAKIIPFVLGGFLYLTSIFSPFILAQQTKKSFTVADEIGLTLFTPPMSVGIPPDIRFSPDGSYFVVWTERGRLDLNCVEDSLRFYRRQDVEDFLKRSDDQSRLPLPAWVVNRAGRQGPIIRDWHWLADSSGLAFLERIPSGNQRLVLAGLQKKTTEALTSAMESVETFDIRDRQHYAYTVADLAEEEGKKKAEREAAAVVGTGRSLLELILPDDPVAAKITSTAVSLWAVVGGRRFEVNHDGVPIMPDGNLALSPDGVSLVTAIPVLDVPSDWETLYPPPPPTVSTYRIHPGHYDEKSSHVHQYVRISLRTSSVQSLTDAPIADDAAWIALGDASWSRDGREILLPKTFLKSKENEPSRPCVAVVEVSSGTSTCVEVLKAHETKTIAEERYHVIYGARFVGGTGYVRVAFMSTEDQSFKTTEYQRTNDTWRAVNELNGLFPAEQNDLGVSVKEGLNDPPMLVATNKKTSQVIWEPNPQLENIELGQASVYTWKDKDDREWKGGLYKPPNYKPGQRYPLVIQTHGFVTSYFMPSGLMTTAFAARALAAAGIMVLQTAAGVAGANCPSVTPEEGPCGVTMLEAAANQLVSDGLVDPERIGIVGFSRSCFPVMETLTFGSLHIKAASITDGWIVTYFQYMTMPERFSAEGNPMIGAAPFREGLQQWLKRSPGFNLDKINAPLLVVGGGSFSLLFMWETYAGLRYLHKPVELVMLNTDEHILTNPAVRVASQGGSVDWFRFWLQGYEDPDPAKADQYARWRELRHLQEANKRNSISPVPQVPSN